jgi:ABC-2 type transport system permease protein
MKKILTVARREYLAAVRTKAFLISTLLMPLLMFGGVFMQRATQKMVDSETYRVAIVDRTAGAKLAATITSAAEARTESLRDPKTGKLSGPPFVIETVVPAPEGPEADKQRLALSDRTRSKELLAFVEIGPRVTEVDVVKSSVSLIGSVAESIAMRWVPTTRKADDTPPNPAALTAGLDAMTQLEKTTPEDAQIRYYTSRPTLLVFQGWLQQQLVAPVLMERFSQSGFGGADVFKLNAAMRGMPVVVSRGMAKRDADGSITYDAKNANVIVSTLVPTVLVALMFIAVMTGASPLATNIIEEKQLRIAEILLGGLRPFELMLGKLLGGAATSVTLAAIYFAGMFIAAQRLGFSQYISGETTAWFILFTLIGVMMYGSLFVAAGAAVTNLKEAQTTLTPVMLIVATPFFVMMNVIQYPTGTLAKVMTFFPITAPSVAIIRAAIPNGAERWELALSAVCSIAGMLLVIWIAGRIFRAGMLLTSKPASIKEAIGWILRG